mgnify:CR=1 FL=1
MKRYLILCISVLFFAQSAEARKNPYINLDDFAKITYHPFYEIEEVTCYKKGFPFDLFNQGMIHYFRRRPFNPLTPVTYSVRSYDYLVDDNGSVADFSTIQDALDAAVDGDRIYVCPGTYEEKINISKDIELISLAGPRTTTIDATNLYDGTVVNLNSSALIEGFTITGAKADSICFYGGGIKISGNPAVASQIYPVVRNNIIRDNVACKVGAIYLGGAATGSGETYVTALIQNNIITDNGAGTSNTGGIGVNCSKNEDSVIENNVIAYNYSASTNGGVELTGSDPCTTYVRNNIFYYNDSVSGRNVITAHGSLVAVVEYNNFFGNTVDYTGGTGNTYYDPTFVNETYFELDPSSSCIDAGDPDSSYNDKDGSLNDMGAYGGPEARYR